MLLIFLSSEISSEVFNVPSESTNFKGSACNKVTLKARKIGFTEYTFVVAEKPSHLNAVKEYEDNAR